MKDEIQEIIDGLERYLEKCDSDNIVCVDNIKVWLDEKHNYITNIKDKAPSHVNWGGEAQKLQEALCMLIFFAGAIDENGEKWFVGTRPAGALNFGDKKSLIGQALRAAQALKAKC